MNRKATVPTAHGTARRRCGPSSALLPERAEAPPLQASIAPRRILECLEEARGAQLAAVEACTAALGDAVSASMVAREPAQLLSAQNEYLRRTMAELARCQGDLLHTCLSLQSEFAQGWAAPLSALVPGWDAFAAGPAIFGASDLETTFDEARQRFEEAARQWFDVWTVAETPNAVVA